MQARFTLTIFTLLLSAAVQVHAETADPAMKTAAVHMRQREFAAALEAAATAPSPAKALVSGMAAFRLGRYGEAATELEHAADDYPLLRDYALYYRAEALHRLGRSAEALQLLRTFASSYPDTVLARRGALLLADTLAATGDHATALDAYRRFVETYVSGSDAVSASLRAAECLEKLGKLEEAARESRRVWLTHPASPVAGKAEEMLRRLRLAGVPEEPFTPEDLLRRGTTQYDMRQFEAALKTFSSIETADEGLKQRVGLRKGQAQFKLRRYSDAERTFAALLDLSAEADRPEIMYWTARAQEKAGKQQDALAGFLKASAAPSASLADDALLEAAFIHKFSERYAEEIGLLREHLARFPKSQLRSRVLWEIGWASYMTKDYAAAAGYFRELSTDDQSADRALYWLGKSLAAAGDAEGADAAYRRLTARAPYGYYASRYRKNAGLPQHRARVSDRDPAVSLPMPAGMERVKGLIALGMTEEAEEELAQQRRKLKSADRKTTAGLARLYLEMGNHNAAMKLVKDVPHTIDADSENLWKLAYPRPFREAVSRGAAKNRLPEPLVYSLMKAESSFSPAVVSPVGAVGLMQLMPSTAKTVAAAEKDKFEVSRLKIPEVNIAYGTRHLRDLKGMYRDDLVLILAAYNAGAHNVAKWRTRYGRLPEDEFIESIPFGETRDYVKKILAWYEIYGILYPQATEAAATPEEPLDVPPLPALAPAVLPTAVPAEVVIATAGPN